MSGENLEIKICGLMGGHSGAEIDKNRANANLLMGRFLYGLKKKASYELYSLEGGQKDNAITREAAAGILAETPEDAAQIKEYAALMEKNFREEYTGSDEGITILVTEKGKDSKQVLHPTSREKVLFYLMNIPFGVQKMSGSIEGLVETSTNLGILKLTDTELMASSGVRSSVESARDAISDKIEYLTEFWEANTKSRVPIRHGIQKGFSPP